MRAIGHEDSVEVRDWVALSESNRTIAMLRNEGTACRAPTEGNDQADGAGRPDRNNQPGGTGERRRFSASGRGSLRIYSIKFD